MQPTTPSARRDHGSLLSILVPCYNEQEVIEECHTRLSPVLASLGAPYEIVFVNDGSRDTTLAHLYTLQQKDPHVVVVELSRNFGHQLAVSAGLDVARGDAVVIIDADLQDPPELIGEMFSLWMQGLDVVYGVRISREGENRFKRWTAKLFYRVINQLADVEIPRDTGDFRLMDRRVVNTLLQMPERHRLLRAMCSWAGYRQGPLPYKRAARYAGETKYPLAKMLRLAFDGIFSFSTAPLRMLTYIGFSAAVLAALGIVWAVSVRILTERWVAGWATLFVGVLFLSGLQMISLGVIGEYIGRIYTEVKQRPLFVIAAIHRTEQPPHQPGL